MKLSKFGQKFTQKSGIVGLMDDIGNALDENPNMIFMGGGNPGQLPEVEKVFQQKLESLLADPIKRQSILGVYQSPQGDKEFRVAVASFLKKQFGWDLNHNNIAISNGSQSAFFILYNMFAGSMPNGDYHSIHLPLSPEYIGYKDIGVNENFFTATRPSIELLDDNLFKYHVDFSTLALSDKTAAMCVSRPANPTGNVLTDDEINHLDELAKEKNIPLIIDGAYGLPFPNIIFTEATPHWNQNTILTLSLSKMGLPGLRTGIVIANEEVIEKYTNVNTIVNLSCGSLGPALAKELFKTGEIVSITQDYIKPFYQERANKAANWFRQYLGNLPYRIHKPEGAIFLWLWFKDLPITSHELYQRLKIRGVLVVPGDDFFVGIDDEWSHKRECLRVSYVQPELQVKQGIQIISEEVMKAYQGI
ncbi:valine--pyruvate transaminase [Colwellia sp. 4_MG-2023]|uniref:valine--pyruvate transaminase n=1 Tax=unclassified Colwellia TaxID=196834 RepID=UPI001C0968D1|nr:MULTISPECIES: valine--pyruvate transaminase [unclassified Colwellia]MBU2925989.1 valine--pyruvate transaminase [Colwellia sp. C2M11]MDO6507696.1 valine--pyruvate transaminase [Colwellia sp. 5_MG-2023]MDO6556298.1 valine--pyruvate transaminase [Colwellia sp. 4_MG-2023]MDO6653129.1 valine--pyruvate transaminase [Colwellia sp. 3_MG-2023]MDO6666118.1 valine--pyruvate transaminase [Colwellia sp. 2_MG-2023]